MHRNALYILLKINLLKGNIFYSILFYSNIVYKLQTNNTARSLKSWALIEKVKLNFIAIENKVRLMNRQATVLLGQICHYRDFKVLFAYLFSPIERRYYMRDYRWANKYTKNEFFNSMHLSSLSVILTW